MCLDLTLIRVCLCAGGYFNRCYPSLLNRKITKSCLPITYFLTAQLFYNFAQSMTGMLPCFVQNFKTNEETMNKLWAKTAFMRFELRREGCPMLKQPLVSSVSAHWTHTECDHWGVKHGTINNYLPLQPHNVFCPRPRLFTTADVRFYWKRVIHSFLLLLIPFLFIKQLHNHCNKIQFLIFHQFIFKKIILAFGVTW